MKVTPMSAMSMPSMNQQGIQQPTHEPLRSIKMQTNATPMNMQDPNLRAQGEQISRQANNPTEVDAATQPLSPQLALLARQRRALQVKEREIQEREKALQSQQAPRPDMIDVARLKTDPLRVLQENGVDFNQLTQHVMTWQGNSEVRNLESKIKSLEEVIDQKFTDKDAQAEKQVLSEMKREADHLANADDTFEMIKATKSVPKVIELISRMYKKTGQILGVQEAMTMYENELVQEHLKLAGLSKIRSQMQPMAQPQQRTYQGMRTLTNRDTASVPMSSKARALAAFYGTLKR